MSFSDYNKINIGCKLFILLVSNSDSLKVL